MSLAGYSPADPAVWLTPAVPVFYDALEEAYYQLQGDGVRTYCDPPSVKLEDAKAIQASLIDTNSTLLFRQLPSKAKKLVSCSWSDVKQMAESWEKSEHPDAAEQALKTVSWFQPIGVGTWRARLLQMEGRGLSVSAEAFDASELTYPTLHKLLIGWEATAPVDPAAMTGLAAFFIYSPTLGVYQGQFGTGDGGSMSIWSGIKQPNGCDLSEHLLLALDPESFDLSGMSADCKLGTVPLSAPLEIGKEGKRPDLTQSPWPDFVGLHKSYLPQALWSPPNATSRPEEVRRQVVATARPLSLSDTTIDWTGLWVRLGSGGIAEQKNLRGFEFIVAGRDEEGNLILQKAYPGVPPTPTGVSVKLSISGLSLPSLSPPPMTGGTHEEASHAAANALSAADRAALEAIAFGGSHDDRDTTPVWTVTAVHPRSPAAQQGVEVGDEIGWADPAFKWAPETQELYTEVDGERDGVFGARRCLVAAGPHLIRRDGKRLEFELVALEQIVCVGGESLAVFNQENLEDVLGRNGCVLFRQDGEMVVGNIGGNDG